MEGFEKRFTIGIDFGTQSARAALYSLADGEEYFGAEETYPHGILQGEWMGEPLPRGWATQVPEDYLTVLKSLLRTLTGRLAEEKLSPASILGIGVDATTSTFFPVKADGTPLFSLPVFSGEKHALSKLWKHHAAVSQTARVDALAKERGEGFLADLGGAVSAEWFLPKVLETLENAPLVYLEADYFVEVMDYITWYLTGELTRSAPAMGYKAFYSKEGKFPPEDFFTSLHPALANLCSEKLAGRAVAVGEKAGVLRPEVAAELGLPAGIAVVGAVPDAHGTAAGVGVTGPGTVFATLGTSACYMLCAREHRTLEGICGCVYGGILPGLYGYEAGQSGFGDIFAWFIKNCVPVSLTREAEEKNTDIYSLMEKKAAALAPGEAGILALDWWNGNRSVLANFSLSGLLMGMTLETRPEEIYRGLLEAAAFGAGTIMDCFREGKLPVEKLVCAGGIAKKSPLLMQLMADILEMPVLVAGADNASCKGGAVLAAYAAGAWDTLEETVRKLSGRYEKEYIPRPENFPVYRELREKYNRLSEIFGQKMPEMMAELRNLGKKVPKCEDDQERAGE